jgi:hypothetical protein
MYGNVKVPKNAVLLIPEPEEGQKPAFGIQPGYYTKPELIALLKAYQDKPAAVLFIADMLETGAALDDEICKLLRAASDHPKTVARIVNLLKS